MIHPGEVMNGYSPSTACFAFGVVSKVIADFPKTESKSVATCLTDIHGEETRLTTGKMNKSSSLRSFVEAPTLYSAAASKTSYLAVETNSERA